MGTGQRDSHARRPRRFRRARRGFFAILGFRMLAVRDRGEAPVRLRCPACGEDAWFVGKRRRAWFTLFFVPVFPLDNADRIQAVCQCRSCRTVFDHPVEQMARRARAAAGNDWAHTIALYNTLRDDPSDAATLNALMEAYAAMGEPHEAVEAARLFPAALVRSRVCQRTLERIRRTISPNG